MPRVDERNSSSYWEDPRIGGLSLLRADFTTHEFPTHTHEALLVAVTEDGGSEVAASGVRDEVHRAALLVVGPGEPHSSRMNRSQRWRYRSFYLEQPAMDAVARSLGIARFPPLRSGLVRRPDLVERFVRLHRGLEAGSRELPHQELLVAAFGGLLGRCAAPGRPAAPASADPVVLRRVMDVMRERHAEHLTLPALAAVAGITQFQLIEMFRAGVGMTPHVHLTQVRLGAACRHLRRGASIAAAAAAAGFYDQSALTRHFKRCYGITPLQYARAVRR